MKLRNRVNENIFDEIKEAFDKLKSIPKHNLIIDSTSLQKDGLPKIRTILQKIKSTESSNFTVVNFTFKTEDFFRDWFYSVLIAIKILPDKTAFTTLPLLKTLVKDEKLNVGYIDLYACRKELSKETNLNTAIYSKVPLELADRMFPVYYPKEFSFNCFIDYYSYYSKTQCLEDLKW